MALLPPGGGEGLETLAIAGGETGATAGGISETAIFAVNRRAVAQKPIKTGKKRCFQ